MVLEGGTTLTWPLWLRASSAGSRQLSISLYYEPVDQSESSIRYRTLRLTFALQVSTPRKTPNSKKKLREKFSKKIANLPPHLPQVEPSLKVWAHLNPSPASLARHFARLDILNQSKSETFWLRQLSCVGTTWVVAPALDLDMISDQVHSGSPSQKYISAALSPPQLLPPGQNLSLFFHLKEVTPFGAFQGAF